MQTAPRYGSAVEQGVDAIWFIDRARRRVRSSSSGDGGHGASLIFLLAWIGYVMVLRLFVPRMRRSSSTLKRPRAAPRLTGRVVDSFTNILTVKLFAHAARRGTICA